MVVKLPRKNYDSVECKYLAFSSCRIVHHFIAFLSSGTGVDRKVR